MCAEIRFKRKGTIMTQLTSIEYGRLVQYAAQKLHLQMLNKTQVNKILFYVYGRFLAVTGTKLFDDDTPKAWPYGPVFPRLNKRINTSEVITFSSEQIAAFNQNKVALDIVQDAVNVMHGKSAQELTEWSHQPGSPWFRTLFEGREDGKQAEWNTEIPESYIKEYFA